MPTQNAKMGLLAFAIVGGLTAAGGAGAYLLMKTRAVGDQPKAPASVSANPNAEPAPAVGLLGPSASREGETWTVREMVGYLQAKGVIAADWKISYVSLVNFSQAYRESGGKLEISKLETADKAKDFASGRDEAAFFAWGRFSVAGQKEIVARAKAALR